MKNREGGHVRSGSGPEEIANIQVGALDSAAPVGLATNGEAGVVVQQSRQQLETRNLKTKYAVSDRQSSDDNVHRIDVRGLGRFRRKLGKKEIVSHVDVDVRSESDHLVSKFDFEFEEETLVQSDSWDTSLPPDDGDLEGHNDILNSKISQREQNVGRASGDGRVRMNHIGPEQDTDVKGVKRKQGLLPVHTNRSMSPIPETLSGDNSDGSILEVESNDLVLEGSPEKKRGFSLPKFRKVARKGSPRYSLDSPVAAMSPSVAIDEVEPAQLHPARPFTVLRQRKPFSATTSKYSAVANHDPFPGDDRPQDGKKAISRILSRGHKSSADPDDIGAVVPITKRHLVAEKLRRKLRFGASRDSCESADFDNAWSSDESESDCTDYDESSRITPGDQGYLDDGHLVRYDGSVLHADDLIDVNAIGTAPHGSKDCIPVKLNRSKDRKERRVKPHVCFAPHKVFMTDEEIHRNMLQPSQVVEDLVSYFKPWYPFEQVKGSEFERSSWGIPNDGRIGSLKVEVLTCVGVAKHKPDISVYLVCGDTAFSTDVIHGCRSPMWPSTSKRAARFPLFHGYARLYVGVFDVTTRKKSENDIFCGRVQLDVASLRPDSEYDVTLPLRQSSFVYDRRPRGVVRLRIALHWFSARAAVLSYLSTPKTLVASFDSIDAPSIPCGDPKTFRNVAVTIHGPELPGKYSHRAFQATMREFNLYGQNCQLLCKQLFRDAVLYVNPLFSLYIFCAWMHCVWSSSLRLAPVYFIGFLVLLLLDGYCVCGGNSARNFGFNPVSLQEILQIVLSTTSSNRMEPLKVDKRPKSTTGTDFDTEFHDHHEFPFSDRTTYRKRTIEEALVKRSAGTRKEREEDLQLQGRLSIYMQEHKNDLIEVESILDDAADGMEIDEADMGGIDFDSDQDLEIHDDVDNVFDLNALEDEEEPMQNAYATLSSISVGTNSRSSILPGPPQDVDIRPKKRIPPQVHLARLEEKLQKITLSISMDKVFASTLAYSPLISTDLFRSMQSTNSADREKKKTKRIPLDEFDKRLGYRNRHTNPVTEIKSSFLGPLMRIFRIFCCMVRIVFNVGVWTDPYLSFWVLSFLVLSMLVLIVFPWRLFFFTVGLAAFGPQNILVRKRFERKASSENDDSIATPTEDGEGGVPKPRADSEDRTKNGSRRGRHNPIAILKERRQKKLAEKQELQKGKSKELTLASSEQLDQNLVHNRRPFAGAGVKSTKKNLQPREVVVPYSQFRKERFYDWPPDPTVARVTPIRFDDRQLALNHGVLSTEKDMEDYLKLRRATILSVADVSELWNT